MKLNSNCLVISKNETLDSQNYANKILYVEDYISIASVKDARILTDDIFKSNESFISKYDYQGYKITWSWYSEIFQLCIKYLEISQLIKAINLLNTKNIYIGNIPDQYKKVLELYFFDKEIKTNLIENKKKLFFKEISFNLLMLLYSLVSIFILSMDNRKTLFD